MSQADTTLRRAWRLIALGERTGHVAYPRANNIDVSERDRTIYSYGRHFPLAQFVPTQKGDRSRGLFVINGDTWSRGWSATPRHQDTTRRVIAEIIKDSRRPIDSLILPNRALDGSGIDVASIRPIHVRPDRREPFRNTATIPARYATRPIPSREVCEERSRASDPRGSSIMMDEPLASSIRLDIRTESLASGEITYSTRTGPLMRRTVWRAHEWRNGSGGWRDYTDPRVEYWFDRSHECTVTAEGDSATLTWSSDRHWLGDSLFMADRVTTRTRTCKDHVADTQDGAPVSWCRNCGLSMDRPGRTVTTTRRRARFVSSFDYLEPWPLYFLAELPRHSRATTVEMAIQDLAPRAVHAALARGLAVERQGDIFAIPTKMTTEEVYARAVRRAYLSAHTHNRKPRPGEVGYAVPMTKDRVRAAARWRVREYRRLRALQLAQDARPTTPKGWRTERRTKRADILARIARQEWRLANPDATHEEGDTVHDYAHTWRNWTPASAERALETAQRDLAHWNAERRPRWKGYAQDAPRRPGLCYSRALSAWQSAGINAVRKLGPAPIDHAAIRATLAIYGTAHTATEVAVCRGGTTYIRGTMRHRPDIVGESRERDHAPRELAEDVWYLAVRNAVPRQ